MAQSLRGSVGFETCASRVTEVPAEVALCERKGRGRAESQGQPVHVGARPGTETGMEIIRHPVRTGDAVGETEEQTERNVTSKEDFKPPGEIVRVELDS